MDNKEEGGGEQEGGGISSRLPASHALPLPLVVLSKLQSKSLKAFDSRRTMNREDGVEECALLDEDEADEDSSLFSSSGAYKLVALERPEGKERQGREAKVPFFQLT